MKNEFLTDSTGRQINRSGKGGGGESGKWIGEEPKLPQQIQKGGGILSTF
jgi:hypothetical protein